MTIDNYGRIQISFKEEEMSELAGGAMGPEMDYKLELVEGKLKFSLSYGGKGGGAEVALLLEGDYFLDKLAALIPGKVDDLVIAALKGALK